MSVKAVARVGDSGTSTSNCTLHGDSPVAFSVTFTAGAGASSTTDADGMKVILANGQICGTTSCGHHVIADTSATYSFADGSLIHRVDDTGHVAEGGGGRYRCTTGSPTVDAI